MLKFKIWVKHEDKFGMLLQLLKVQFNANNYSVEGLDIESEKEYISFLILHN